MTIVRTALSIALLLGLVVTPFPAEAQPATSPARIGLLPFGSPSNAYDRSLVEAFRHGLREVGVVENRDVVLDVAWIGSEPETSTAVSELIQRGAKLLIPFGTSASLATKRQASTIPILFISVGNPVGIGLVESLSRPGGNVTGFSDILLDLSGKYVQFARELGKTPATIDYLWHRAWGDGQNRLRATERAAQSAGVKLRPQGIGDIGELNDVMASVKKAGAMTLIVQPSPFTYRYRSRLVDAATKNGLATIFRRAASYADRILKGTKPADLAVQEPTKLDLIINLRTAKALGRTIPQSLLVQATEIIQ